MDDAMIVDNGLRAGVDLQGDASTSSQGEAALLFEHLFEVLPFDVFHRVEVMAVLQPDSIEADDMGMFELAQGFDLALEALQEADFLGQLGGEHFEGGLPTSQLFLGEIDAPHAAAAELLEDDPFAQSIADHASPMHTRMVIQQFIVSCCRGMERCQNACAS